MPAEDQEQLEERRKRDERNQDLWNIASAALLSLGLTPKAGGLSPELIQQAGTRSTLYDELVELLDQQNRATYELALQQEVLRAGGDPDSVTLTNEDVLAELRVAAEQSAARIMVTFSTDLARMIAAAPAGIDTGDLGRLIELWARERALWKARQIARTEVASAIERAQKAFIERTGAHGQARFGGSLQCRACQAIAIWNPYEIDDPIVGTHPHPGCLDEWVPEYTDIDPEQIWTGA